MQHFINGKYSIKITEYITNAISKKSRLSFPRSDSDTIYIRTKAMLDECSEKLFDIWDNQFYDGDEYITTFSIHPLQYNRYTLAIF